MPAAAAALAAAATAAAPAWAGHDHGGHGDHGDHGGHGDPGGRAAAPDAEPLGLTVTAGVVAATYRGTLYEGDYEGALAGAAFARGRYEASASMTGYRIVRNGRAATGLGDLMVHGSASLLARGPVSAGAHLMLMAPTGADQTGLGMGHFMLMPALWSAYAAGAARASASVGYARVLGDAGAHAEHGAAWPLVDPMAASELTLEVAGTLALARALAAGALLRGALPLEGSDARLLAGLRVAWRAGRVEVAAEGQAGVLGAPVRVRGLLSTSLSF
jgi:hypothetical protein